VDDNADPADLLAEVLAAKGYMTRVVYDKFTALDAADTFAPDVNLLDLGLATIAGYELAQRLKQLPALASMSLVALSGYGQPVR
jgi:CheY-like chemotaxis protein